MILDDLSTRPSYRLYKILSLLESRFEVVIDFGAAKNVMEIRSLHESYGREKARIISESAHNSYNHDASYTKAALIQEALAIFLSEVAPKRIKKTNPSS